MDDFLYPTTGPDYAADFGFSSIPTGYAPSGVMTPLTGSNPPPTAWQKAMGFTGADGMKTAGWAPTALGAASGIFNGWLGLEKLDVAKQTLAENKRQFDMNWGAQKGLVNSDLEARQRARVGNRPDAYRSVGDYMQTYGVK